MTTVLPTSGPGSLREAWSSRVVVADGAMGTMLQARNPSLEDFEGHEGCNEILNVTRPDVVADVHAAYLDVGADCVETNTFGANLANLGEYGISDRIYELAAAGAAIARSAADARSTPERPRWVLGSVGPGTKLPSLGHVSFRELRDSYRVQVEGLIDGGVDAILIETAQDLLQAKAALIGARRALDSAGLDLPVIAQVTVETTGTMLLGSEIGAALTALEPLGIDVARMTFAPGFMAELAAVVQVAAWEDAGLRSLIPLDFPPASTALSDLVWRYHVDPLAFMDPTAGTAVFNRVVQAWALYCHPDAREILGCDVVMATPATPVEHATALAPTIVTITERHNQKGASA